MKTISLKIIELFLYKFMVCILVNTLIYKIQFLYLYLYLNTNFSLLLKHHTTRLIDLLIIFFLLLFKINGARPPFLILVSLF